MASASASPPLADRTTAGTTRDAERTIRRLTFSRFASTVVTFTARPTAFAIAVALVLVWAVTGPFFDFSETWQLVINTGTTIVTFLMVFAIQNAQNRDSLAIQLKLDELIHATRDARNTLVGIENMDDTIIDGVKREIEEQCAEPEPRVPPAPPGVS